MAVSPVPVVSETHFVSRILQRAPRHVNEGKGNEPALDLSGRNRILNPQMKLNSLLMPPACNYFVSIGCLMNYLLAEQFD
jgi:hypothetical protein